MYTNVEVLHRSIYDIPVLTIDSKEYEFSVVEDELRAVIPEYRITPNSVIGFTLSFKSKGMEKLNFSPNGTDYVVGITANYPSPSFKGDFLPSTRNVTDKGFEAKWELTALNTCNAYSSSFGVDFIVTAGQYQQTERTIKYSFLFVILIFSAIFLVESITKSKISIVQYIVTGLSLCLFYLLLLSITEYISFGWRPISFGWGVYLIAAGMTTGALLCGSLALFAILCVIMYFTRKEGTFGSGETIK